MLQSNISIMAFDFKNIEFSSVHINSINVYTYFGNFVVRNFDSIESFKKKRFKNYADKQNKSIDEVLQLYDIGFKNGITKAQKTVIEKNNIAPKAGMYYLFEIASTYNLEAKYYNNRINDHFKEFVHDKFEPKIIIEIGEIMGEYYYSWLQVLENHRVFEPLFKPEIDKTKNNFINKPLFPVHGVIIVDLPQSMNIAKDFRATLYKMNIILEIRLQWLKNGIMDNLNSSEVFRYDILKDLRKQCADFLQETTDNTNNDIFEKYVSFYQQINNELKKSIEIFSIKAKAYHTMDMSYIYEYKFYNKNWFVVVLDYLNFTNESFNSIAKFDNLLTGFTCTLHPDTVKEVFDYMVEKEHLSGKLSYFQAIFSNTPTHEINPVKWLITSNSGKTSERGNQASLFIFLEMMLGKVSNKDLIKSKDLFIDEKGFFIKDRLNRAKKIKGKNEYEYLYGFERRLKQIIEKARPA